MYIFIYYKFVNFLVASVPLETHAMSMNLIGVNWNNSLTLIII